MSSYVKLTMHPESGQWEEAEWLDDHFGHHNYGVRFPDGMVYDPRKVDLKTKGEDDEEEEA